MIDFRGRIGASQVLAGVTVLALVTLAAACAGRSVPTDRMLKPTLGAAQAVDTTTGLAVLPIVPGRAGGAAAWFVVTESSDSADAARRRVNWAPRLSMLRGTAFTQRGTITDGRLEVPAGVDFAPSRLVRPAPDSAFPPVEARPGSVAREGYSPLVGLAGGTVLNAPVIATVRLVCGQGAPRRAPTAPLRSGGRS